MLNIAVKRDLHSRLAIAFLYLLNPSADLRQDHDADDLSIPERLRILRSGRRGRGIRVLLYLVPL